MPYLLSEERVAITDVRVHVVDLALVLFGEAGHITAELQNHNPRAVGDPCHIGRQAG
jgi:hypothetical protein